MSYMLSLCFAASNELFSRPNVDCKLSTHLLNVKKVVSWGPKPCVVFFLTADEKTTATATATARRGDSGSRTIVDGIRATAQGALGEIQRGGSPHSF